MKKKKIEEMEKHRRGGVEYYKGRGDFGIERREVPFKRKNG